MSSAQARIDPYVRLLLRHAEPRRADEPHGFVAHTTPEAAQAMRRLPGLRIEAAMPFGPDAVNLTGDVEDHATFNDLRALPGLRRVVGTAHGPYLPVLLHLRHAEWDGEVPGMVPGSRIGPFLSAMVNADALAILETDERVVSVEASHGGVAMCSRSMPFVRADVAHAPPIGESGAGAMVGVIDQGIDVLHEAFQDGSGKSRILYVWDQADPSGPAPSAVDPAFAAQRYGTLHTKADIDGFISAGSTGTLGRDLDGHGTHVASIAVGSPVPSSGFPGGVAPQAALVVVVAKLQAGSSDPQSLGYSVSHVDALAFIRAAAEKVGMPVAVNVSLGQNAGGHDGMSPLELAFDSFCGNGREPGYVVVKAAGNEFGYGGHAYVQAFEGGVIPIEWVTDRRARVQDYVEFWSSSADDLQWTVTAPTGLSCMVDRTTPSARAADPNGAFTIDLTLTRFHRDNGETQLLVLVWQPAGGAINVDGKWRLDIFGQSVRSEGGIHGWVERDDLARALHFETGSTDDVTLSIPATARTVIAVGACASAHPLSLYGNSSRGPTRDARAKPELVAPGIGIQAAKAGTADGLVAMSGTSMAAPHVAGAVALLLARRARLGQPQLNAMQVRMALSQSVDRFSGRWQPAFGVGRLDVAALLATFL